MLAELNHVEKHYKGFSLDCSLKVQEGCVTGLIGANGAGKSTTFKALLNLIKIDAGEIKLFDKSHQVLQAADKEEIGVVLPESSFSPYLNAKQITGIMEKMYRNFDRQKFAQQCSRFSLPMDKKVKDFSTGMKAKLKVLLAMSHQAKLLILDEPTVGLDVIARDQILDMLREYMEEEERGILISSHISTDLEGLCDDLYMIDRGKIVLHEDTDVLMDQYGILKADDASYSRLDKKYIIRVKKEPFGYRCLTQEKSYYLENYPTMVIEKSSIDEVISMIVKGEVL